MTQRKSLAKSAVTTMTFHSTACRYRTARTKYRYTLYLKHVFECTDFVSEVPRSAAMTPRKFHGKSGVIVTPTLSTTCLCQTARTRFRYTPGENIGTKQLN